MIIDAIIAFVVGLFEAGVVAGSFVVVPVINVVLFCIEAILNIFFTGISLTRLERRERSTSGWLISIVFAALVLLVVGMLAWPHIRYRDVTLVADDGRSLPLAGVEVQIGSKVESHRTRLSGKLTVPRFVTTSITLKDPRYQETTWGKSEFAEPLVAKRSTAAALIDKAAERVIGKELLNKGLDRFLDRNEEAK